MAEDANASEAPDNGRGLTTLGVQLEQLRPAAQRFGFRLLGHVQDAEEAVQNAFLRLLQASGRFEGRSSFRTYVFAAVRNSCIDKRRKRVTKSGRLREVNPDTTAFFRQLPQDGRFAGVSTQLQRRESQEIVRAAIDMLPEKQRACVILRDLEGLRYREVAEVMGITPNHVGVLLYKARTGLKKLIEEGDLIGDD